MAVPNMRRALRGWVKTKTVYTVTKSKSTATGTYGDLVETLTSATLKINLQPVPQTRVDRKPEFQRTWKWWSLIVQGGDTILSVDDIIIIDSVRYRVQGKSDWRESGFTKYEVIEDYERDEST